MQDLLVWIIIAGAAAYLVRHFKTQFAVKSSCGKACGGCSALKNKAEKCNF